MSIVQVYMNNNKLINFSRNNWNSQGLYFEEKKIDVSLKTYLREETH